jgi:hypothetical protein
VQEKKWWGTYPLDPLATMAKTLVHQWQQHHHDQGNNTSLTMSNKGNNACMLTHANEHIIHLCLHAPSQTYHMFELASQLANLVNISLQASSQNLPTFAVGKRTTNENCYTMTFGGDMVSKMALRVSYSQRRPLRA